MRSDADHLQKLMAYSAWANDILYRAISRVDETVLFQPRPGRPGGAIGVLAHIYVVGMIWKGHLISKAHGFSAKTLETLPALVDLRTWQSGLDHWYLEFSAGLNTCERKTLIDFYFVDGGKGSMTAEEMLMHVANHGTYHRGYVADMLYDSGLKPPTMDLPVFIRDTLSPDRFGPKAVI